MRFELRAGGALAGSVRLGPNQSAEDLRITVNASGDFRYVAVKPDGRFEQTALPGGTAKVVVNLETRGRSEGRESRVVIDGIEIVPEQTDRDPRLQGIRLEGGAHELAIRVDDENRNPVRGALVTVVKPQGAVRVRSGSDGVATLRVPELPVDLVVEAFGYRSNRLAEVRDDRRVVLAKGLAVLLTTNVKTLGSDPAWRLGVMVSQVDPRSGMQSFPFHRTAPMGGTYFDDYGELRLPMPAPGTCLIMPHVVVVGPAASGGGIGMTTPPRITVRDTPALQTFRIELRQDLLDAAIQRYAK